MRALLRKLWRDDTGALLATEWVFMAVILVIGVVPGMVALRNAMNAALAKSACQLNSSSCACSGFTSTAPSNPVTINVQPCD
jgi:Flp pilus assembly pilin Flp